MKEDDAEAARWFRRGAELGDTSSMFHLARFLLNGKAVPAGTPAAIALFERAAALNSSDEMTSLGWAYQDGNGLPKDTARGARWFVMAAEYGSWSGAHNLHSVTFQGDPWTSKA